MQVAEKAVENSPFKCILAANRGEIAVRIFRAADEMLIKSVRFSLEIPIKKRLSWRMEPALSLEILSILLASIESVQAFYWRSCCPMPAVFWTDKTLCITLKCWHYIIRIGSVDMKL